MISRTSKKAGLCGALAALLATGTALALVMSSFQTALIPLEGGGAGFQAVNKGTNALGAFQLTPVALRDLGYKDANGNWTAKAQAMGIASDTDFLNNPEAQVAIDNEYNQKNIQYLGSTYTNALGTTDLGSGATLTQGNLAYCAEALGAGGCRQYLATGQVPAWELQGNPAWANGGFQRNMQAMANTSLTDSGNVTVTTTSSTGSNGTTTSTTSVQGIFCDPAVLQQISQTGQTMADNWTLLASRPETGYTLLGGQSVLEAAGLIQPGQPGYVGNTGLFGGLAQAGQGTPFGGASFAMASCLNRLTSGSVDILFGTPSLGNIIDTLLQAACNMASQLFSQVTAPLTQSVYQAFSLNGLVPGLNLGSLGVGGGISLGQGGQGGLLNINGGALGNFSYGPDTGWYQRAPSTGGGGAPSYGSLFGRGQYGGFGGGSAPATGGLY